MLRKSSQTCAVFSRFWPAGTGSGRMRLKKRRKYRLNLVRVRRSYSIGEIADLLNLHVGTVRIWRKKGMGPIDPDDRPLLFVGAEIKRFLSERRKNRKIRLKDDEFYCPRCRRATRSIPGGIRIIDTGRTMGANDRQVEIKGICAVCECRLTRFGTVNGIKGSFFDRMITQGHGRLIRNSDSTVNTHFKEA